MHCIKDEKGSSCQQSATRYFFPQTLTETQMFNNKKPTLLLQNEWLIAISFSE